MKTIYDHKLTLSQPAIYQIKVPGELNEDWLEMLGKMTITVERETSGLVVSVLTGTLDQAALQGLLHQLYSLGIPLIEVTCLDCKTK